MSFPQNLPFVMFYHVSVISDQWNVICIAVVVGLQWGSGESHEDLFADDAYRRSADRCPLHVGPRKAPGNIAAITKNCIGPPPLGAAFQSMASGKARFPANIS
jgi:hypothetical protein